MKKILVPTDFSTTAMKAVAYAEEIAKRTGAAVYVIHIIEPIAQSIMQPYLLDEGLQQEITNSRLIELNSIKKNLEEKQPNLKIETELLFGTVITSIHSFAEKQQVDLIIMGTTGASGIKEFFLGSVAARTIENTKIPVLTIPYNYLMEAPDNILFATNHFEENKNLLGTIVELATVFSATIHTAVFMDTGGAEASDYLHNTRQLNHYIGALKEMYVNTNFKSELLEGSDFEEAVEKYDVKNEVDIIAMITYPKSFWEKFLKKSATKKMAFHSKIPLLAIPAT